MIFIHYKPSLKSILSIPLSSKSHVVVKTFQLFLRFLLLFWAPHSYIQIAAGYVDSND